MTKRKDATEVGRRGFLKGAALAGAATTIAAPLTAKATPLPPKRMKSAARHFRDPESRRRRPRRRVDSQIFLQGAASLVSPTSGLRFHGRCL